MPVEAARRCRAASAGSTTACCATATSRQCSPEALALYVLLVCAADAQGLSYYSDARIAQLLALAPPALSAARRQLMAPGLIAYQKPLYQLLSLQGEVTAEPSPRRPLRSASRRPRPAAPRAWRSKPPSNGSCNRSEAPPHDRL